MRFFTSMFPHPEQRQSFDGLQTHLRDPQALNRITHLGRGEGPQLAMMVALRRELTRLKARIDELECDVDAMER